jgi:hypothetical protein
LTNKALYKGDETKNFYLTKIDSSTIENYWENSSNSIEMKPTSIFLRNNSNENLFEFSISDFEFYENTTLKEI